MTTTIEQRVAKGATWLDTVRPGWRDAIDSDALDMADACGCVCGHVFGQMTDAHTWAVNGYEYAVDTFADSTTWARDHGFTVPGMMREQQSKWLELERAWLGVITGPPVPVEQREAQHV